MSNFQAESKEQIQRELESLQGIDYVPTEYLQFRISLWQGQFKIFESLPAPFSVPTLPLGPGSFTPEPELAGQMLLELARSLKGTTKSKEELLKLVEKQKLLPEIIDWAVFGINSEARFHLSSDAGIGSETLLFFGRSLAAPYIFRLVMAVKEKISELPETSHRCPYCGSEPGLALLKGETGKRFLACSLCGREWEYLRLSCPFCGAENSLELIKEEEGAVRWIEACSLCEHYLKTIDARKLKAGALIPLKEVILGLYLDFIAQAEGFRAGLPYVALR